jgi:hypothetical protein
MGIPQAVLDSRTVFCLLAQDPENPKPGSDLDPVHGKPRNQCQWLFDSIDGPDGTGVKDDALCDDCRKEGDFPMPNFTGVDLAPKWALRNLERI